MQLTIAAQMAGAQGVGVTEAFVGRLCLRDRKNRCSVTPGRDLVSADNTAALAQALGLATGLGATALQRP